MISPLLRLPFGPTQPRSCPELAQLLNLPTQQVNYDMRKLAEAGLVERIDERRVRGTVEGIYQARAASYWLSPKRLQPTSAV